MDKYVCPCGYVYDPAVGDPENGVAPGTPWKRFLQIGSARSAAWARICSRRSNPEQPENVKRRSRKWSPLFCTVAA